MDEATEVARSFTNGQDTDAAVVTVGITSGQHIAEAFAAIRKGRHSRGHRHGTDVRGGDPHLGGGAVVVPKKTPGQPVWGLLTQRGRPRQLEMYRTGILSSTISKRLRTTQR